MILEHHTFELFGKEVFVRAVLQTPFSQPNPMPDEACFLFVRKGVGIAYSETNQVTAKASEGILMKCGSFFHKMEGDQEDTIYEAIAVHFHPEVLSKIYGHDLPSFLTSKNIGTPVNPAKKIEPDELFEKFFDSLLYYFSNPQLVNEELMALKLKELLLLLENTPESDKLHQILSSLFSPQQYSFKSIIEAHLFEPLSLDGLATICGMSLSSFKRRFKEIFKESPAKYIKEQRLSKASDLLKDQHLSISEIAYTCAFSDVALFSNSFRQFFGQSPTDYRNEMKQRLNYN
ncbi:helix-turn-helix domain-containing protein [Reichenbachiella sp.]|uniref:helix-turn-helix domain-containing protein n=1 Tax=Reichenbachiella sp. TaxID=2184521 RepID=UPI003B5BDF7C